MNSFIASLFLVAGIVNFAPLIGVSSVEQLGKLYQIDILNRDVALLLRHRAVLFGIVGTLIIGAAFLPHLRTAAAIAGLVSMMSFIVLVLFLKTSNSSLMQIAWVDVFAIVALLLGFILHIALQRTVT